MNTLYKKPIKRVLECGRYTCTVVSQNCRESTARLLDRMTCMYYKMFLYRLYYSVNPSKTAHILKPKQTHVLLTKMGRFNTPVHRSEMLTVYFTTPKYDVSVYKLHTSVCTRVC